MRRRGSNRCRSLWRSHPSGAVFRPPGSGQDFYTLFEKWVSGEKLTEHEESYVVAVLIRGGVFGGGG
ncbi:type I-F CRISPR-associated protein Cas7f/Csy3 [Morganella morganii]